MKYAFVWYITNVYPINLGSKVIISALWPLLSQKRMFWILLKKISNVYGIFLFNCCNFGFGTLVGLGDT